MYNVGSQIKLKASNLRSSLGDYSVAYILVKVTITPKIPNNWYKIYVPAVTLSDRDNAKLL